MLLIYIIGNQNEAYTALLSENDFKGREEIHDKKDVANLHQVDSRIILTQYVYSSVSCLAPVDLCE